MFGIGGEDKDKLKENMEDIKQMVNSSTPDQQPPQKQQKETDELGEDFPQGFEEDNSSPDQNINQTQSFSQDPDQTEQNDLSEPSEKSFEERFQTEEKSDTLTQRQNQQQNKKQHNGDAPDEVAKAFDSPPQNQENSSNEQNTPQQAQEPQSQQNQDRSANSTAKNNLDSRLNDSIPEPAETKQINVPEIDKGTLFIRRQKFESAKNMIREMRYLSREIEDVVNQLERGIEEDRATEKEAKELLHSLEQDRSGVKNIISQQKGNQQE